MPDIDRTADIKVTAAHGTVTAEIPLAGHASERNSSSQCSLASQRMRELHTEAKEREDRTWVIVWLPSARPDFDPASALDAAYAVIREVNGIDQQFQSGAAQIEAAVRDWWTHQQR